MECIKCNSKNLENMGEKFIREIQYKNVPTKPPMGTLMGVAEGKVELYAETYMCTECGFVMEIVPKGDLEFYLKHKKYIV